MTEQMQAVATLRHGAQLAAANGDDVLSTVLLEATVLVLIHIPSLYGVADDLIAACVRLADQLIEGNRS